MIKTTKTTKTKSLLVTTLLLFILFFVSCGTAPPSWEGAGVPARSETIDSITPQWTPYAEEGLALFAGKVAKPRLEFWALRVDLTEPGLAVTITGPEPVNGVFREGYMPATTVSLFVERYNCVAGLNTNPFSPVSAKVGEERAIDGIAVSDGILAARPNPRFDALVFYDSDTAAGRRAAIVSQGELGDLSGITNAVGGFQIVLREGVPVGRVLDQAAGGEAPRHPRSAAGLSADGGTLYLLAVDGRRFGSVGVTEAELALLLKRLGARDGLNFDGGGSTALVLRSLKADGENPYGEARPVNTPIHKQIRGWERAVAVCLGIRVERKK